VCLHVLISVKSAMEQSALLLCAETDMASAPVQFVTGEENRATVKWNELSFGLVTMSTAKLCPSTAQRP
jgi:hypothetical protein